MSSANAAMADKTLERRWSSSRGTSSSLPLDGFSSISSPARIFLTCSRVTRVA